MTYWAMAAVLASTLQAGDGWTEFRGPGGQGRSDAKGLPREWSETKNVVWKTALHGRAWSSPVVWGDQIWLTTATDAGTELFALCVDRETGKVLIDARIFEVKDPIQLWRKYNTYASPTPAVEEGRVYVHYGHYGTACLATDSGKVLWARTDLPCNHFRGAGSSPILYRDFLIVTLDGYDEQYLVALDKKTGKTVWRADRNYDFGTTDGDLKKAFSTPIVIEVAGKPQLITTAAKAAVAYDPMTGQELWKIRYGNHSSGTRPLFGHGLVYISNGSPPTTLIAVRPDGKGDVTATHVVWKWSKGVGQKPSPLLVDDLLYVAADAGGLFTCLDAKTGAQVWQERVIQRGQSASPIFADGVIYLFAEDGTSVALQPGREFKELARNKLDSGCMATPAVAGKALFVRTASHLYRIESR
jgi:outer membrane protein assembly factor BamB